MSPHVVEPERLVDLPAERDLVGVSALVRAAATPPKVIAPAARQLIRGRLYASLAGRDPVFHPRWRMALTLFLTLAAGGVVGAATHSVILGRSSPNKGVESAPVRETSGKRKISLQSMRSTPRLAEMPAEQDSPTVPSPERMPAASPQPAVPSAEAWLAQAPPSPSAPLVDSVASPVAVASATPAQHSQPPAAAQSQSTSSRQHVLAGSPRISRPLVATSSAPAPQTDGTRPPAEATVLAQAIRTLRVDGDATAALKLLDEHHARFTEGALSPEASAVRIEALLRLGRTDAALADLERLPLHALPRREEWHVVRGELRAQAGRWSSAEADFAVVLSGHLPGAGGAFAERALWGRAVARSHQGDVVGARSDTLEYLQRFPDGRFAGLAHRALLAP